MQELIFIITLAVFIGGMFWSDLDSRRWRFGEPFPPWSAARETLMAFREFQQSVEMTAYRASIMSAAFQGFIKDTPYLEDILNRDPSHPIFHGKTAELKKASRDALNQGYIITHRKSLTESEEK